MRRKTSSTRSRSAAALCVEFTMTTYCHNGNILSIYVCGNFVDGANLAFPVGAWRRLSREDALPGQRWNRAGFHELTEWVPRSSPHVFHQRGTIPPRADDRSLQRAGPCVRVQSGSRRGVWQRRARQERGVLPHSTVCPQGTDVRRDRRVPTPRIHSLGSLLAVSGLWSRKASAASGHDGEVRCPSNLACAVLAVQVVQARPEGITSASWPDWRRAGGAGAAHRLSTHVAVLRGANQEFRARLSGN